MSGEDNELPVVAVNVTLVLIAVFLIVLSGLLWMILLRPKEEDEGQETFKKTRPIWAVIFAQLVLAVALITVSIVIGQASTQSDGTSKKKSEKATEKETEKGPQPVSEEVLREAPYVGRGYNAEEYRAARQRLLVKDQKRALGAQLELTHDELIIDAIILEEKKDIMEKSRVDRMLYTPALSFFKSKMWMESTTTFEIIRRMPKGAALHVHSSAMVSLEYVVQQITYRDKIYMCTDEDGIIRLNTFLNSSDVNQDCDWKLVADERKQATSEYEFNQRLLKGLSFLTYDPLTKYNGTNRAWDRFEKYFKQMDVIDNEAIYRDYFRQALQEFHEDNIQYIEFRSGLGGLIDETGTERDEVHEVELYLSVLEEFIQDNPDFLGAKVIVSDARMKSKRKIEKEVRRTVELRKQFPHFVLGYDLVAQEDFFNPLSFYIDALLYPTQNSVKDALPYFFHAGETNWQGTDVDENLIDAILLNATRIGHGYALAKHPELADLVKSRGIAVEVNPISNQLLGLVKDLRNHALVPLLADDFPLVVSSDDPGTWEAYPLTHDFFVAFMDLSGQDMGLGFLKQLAINSIKYSALNSTEKERAFELWQTKWDQYVTDLLIDLSGQ